MKQCVDPPSPAESLSAQILSSVYHNPHYALALMKLLGILTASLTSSLLVPLPPSPSLPLVTEQLEELRVPPHSSL